jgi:glycosyltransferase involved in cell wall biosynthesis
MAAVMADVAVIVPTHRRPDRLRRLLDALATQTIDETRWELIVVDDCSDDPAVDELLATLPELVPCRTRSLRTSRNGGPAAARNLGWLATTAPVVAFVDDDVVPDTGWLAAGLSAFADPAMGVVQGETRVPDGIDVHALPPWSLWRQIDGVTPFFEGCNIFYRRAALEHTTGFDEEIGFYGEDVALGWQVVEAGWARGFCRNAGVVHDVEIRGTGWFARNGWLERHVVALAARHPGFRREAFWRPWAFRKRDAAFVLAVASALAGVRWPPAWLGVLPYLWWGRPSIRDARFLRVCVETLAVDAARSAGHLTSAVRHRALIV